MAYANDATNEYAANYLGSVKMPNCTYPVTFLSNVNSGDNDLYTVPAGKRAICLAMSVFNGNGSTLTFYPEIKVSATYYRILGNNTAGTGTNANAQLNTIILEAGEKLSVNTNVNNVNVWARVIEFDNTANIFTSKVTAPASGDNTIYTVPAGKRIVNLPNTLTAAVNGSTFFANASGGSLNVSYFAVPSGGSSGTTNQTKESASVSNAAVNNAQFNVTLGAGDFIVGNLSGTGTASLMWTNLLIV